MGEKSTKMKQREDKLREQQSNVQAQDKENKSILDKQMAQLKEDRKKFMEESAKVREQQAEATRLASKLEKRETELQEKERKTKKRASLFETLSEHIRQKSRNPRGRGRNRRPPGRRGPMIIPLQTGKQAPSSRIIPPPRVFSMALIKLKGLTGVLDRIDKTKEKNKWDEEWAAFAKSLPNDVEALTKGNEVDVSNGTVVIMNKTHEILTERKMQNTITADRVAEAIKKYATLPNTPIRTTMISKQETQGVPVVPTTTKKKPARKHNWYAKPDKKPTSEFRRKAPAICGVIATILSNCLKNVDKLGSTGSRIQVGDRVYGHYRTRTDTKSESPVWGTVTEVNESSACKTYSITTRGRNDGVRGKNHPMEWIVKRSTLFREWEPEWRKLLQFKHFKDLEKEKDIIKIMEKAHKWLKEYGMPMNIDRMKKTLDKYKIDTGRMKKVG